jgi:hypothetical protein
MTAVQSLQELLTAEDDPAFVEERCPDTSIPAWPAIRNDFVRTALADLFYAVRAFPGERRPTKSLAVAANALHSWFVNSARKPHSSPILILATGAGLLIERGRTVNRIVDPVADELGARAWTLEWLDRDRWPVAPRANPRLTFAGGERFMELAAGIAAARSVHRRVIRRLIDLACERAADAIGWSPRESTRRHLVATGARRLAAYPFQARLTERALRERRVRLALVEEGAYGHRAVFNWIARQQGIPVAELQHGVVTRGHDAYNVAPTLAASPAYGATQPSAFLSYGGWWSSQFNAPIPTRTPIGNPFRSHQLRSWRPDPLRRDVVVLGDGIDTDRTIAFSRDLARLIPDRTIAFRPHPLERERVSRSEVAPARLDLSPSLYDALARTYAVVGEVSTGLFEAIGLVPTIVVWDTPKSRLGLAEHPFRVASDAFAAARLVADPQPGPDLDPSEFWASGWEDHLETYVRSAVE